MSEQNTVNEDPVVRKQNILSITPDGMDPVLYWHQVAQDAIHARERNDKKYQDDKWELERLRQNERNEQKRRIKKLEYDSIPNFKSLLECVHSGDFSMTVQFSFYPNCDNKGYAKGGYSDDE